MCFCFCGTPHVILGLELDADPAAKELPLLEGAAVNKI